MRPPSGVYIAVVAGAFGLATLVTFIFARNNNTVAGFLDALFIVIGIGSLELWSWRRRRKNDSKAGRPATLTFLFADVEGSTRLLERLGGDYGSVLEDLERIVRATAGSWDGDLVDTQGDQFFLAFGGPGSAVRAALDIHGALAKHRWPSGSSPRVRIGIHTGEATTLGPRYLGMAVHRAARICAAGHGGQTLVSSTTLGLLADDRDGLSGIETRDLGEPHLKDIHRPVRIYQATATGSAEEFPPLRVAEPRPPFAGEEARLADAVQDLRTKRN